MNGLLLIDKEPGMTSHDVVSILRKKLNTRKIGHAGTLDPIATGLLLMGIGNGTRLLEYLQGMDKTYFVSAQLGMTSDTFDTEGNLEKGDLNILKEISLSKVLEIIDKYKGVTEQVPPKYSAIKINGRKAYDMARKGEVVDMPKRRIKINGISDIVLRDDNLEMVVSCGSGTYIRSLIHDIGQDLGCGAVMTDLRRKDIGKYNIDNAKKLDDINEEDIIPVEEIDLGIKKYNLNLSDMNRLVNGQSIHIDIEHDNKEIVASYYDNRLIAICIYDSGKLKPKKVLGLK